VEGKFEHKESRMMGMLGLNLAQGIFEKELANKECQAIFEDIDPLLLKICRRFWDSHHKK